MFRSPSWAEEETYRTGAVPRHQLATKTFEDLAIITKIANPWNPEMRLIWVAGIRGIGTWGAAEFLKKRWQELYDLLPDSNKDCDFSALLRIRYHNCDIEDTTLINVCTREGSHAPPMQNTRP